MSHTGAFLFASYLAASICNQMRQRDVRFETRVHHKSNSAPLHNKAAKPHSLPRYPPRDFIYDPRAGTCVCPAGKSLSSWQSKCSRRCYLHPVSRTHTNQARAHRSDHFHIFGSIHGRSAESCHGCSSPRARRSMYLKDLCSLCDSDLFSLSSPNEAVEKVDRREKAQFSGVALPLPK